MNRNLIITLYYNNIVYSLTYTAHISTYSYFKCSRVTIKYILIFFTTDITKLITTITYITKLFTRDITKLIKTTRYFI